MKVRGAVGVLSLLPLLFVSWVNLVAVDQPLKVGPGQSFQAVVTAEVVQEGRPLPEEPALPEAARRPAPVRLGIMVPDRWSTSTVEWSSHSDAGTLDPAPEEELWTYQALKAAPAGYHWEAYGPAFTSATWGDLQFRVTMTAGSAAGRYELAYATWDQPLYDTIPFHVLPHTSLISALIDVGEVGPAPQVVAFDPPDGAGGVPVQADLGVVFSREMDVGSLRSGGILLYEGPVYFPAGRVEWDQSTGDAVVGTDIWIPPWPQPQPVAMEVFWSRSEKRAIVFPLQLLKPRTIYTLAVTPSAKAADGVAVELYRVSTFLTAPGPSSPLFWDVPPSHRFNEAIETLARAGIVDGFPDGGYHPDENVTRLQLAVMMVKLLGLHTPLMEPCSPFQDIPAGEAADTAADYVGEAGRAGLVLGFEDGTFRPGDAVTRIQMVRMIVRAAQVWLQPPPVDYDPGFGDVAPADLSYVDWAAYNHLVDGKAPGVFDPWSSATRGHAARVLFGVWRLLPQPL